MFGASLHGALYDASLAFFSHSQPLASVVMPSAPSVAPPRCEKLPSIGIEKNVNSMKCVTFSVAALDQLC